MTNSEKLPFKNHKDTKNIKKFLKKQAQNRMNMEAKDKYLAVAFQEKCQMELEVKVCRREREQLQKEISKRTQGDCGESQNETEGNTNSIQTAI